MAKAAKQGFVKPTIEQVETFINIKKPEWPAVFSRYLAEKFWNHYQSNGWKISGRAMMQDYKAAVCAQWLNLKFKEDKEYLEICYKAPSHRIALDRRRQETAGLFAEQEAMGAVRPLDRTLDFLDEIMASCLSGGASDSQLRTACDWLRGNNLLRLPREQIDRIKIQAGNDGDFSKLIAIKQFFANLKTKDLTVKSYVHSKMTKA